MSQFSHSVSIPFPDKERKYIFPFLGWRVIDFYVGKVIPSGWHTPFVCLVCRESPNKKRRPIGRGRLPKNCGSCRRGRRPPDLHSYKTALPAAACGKSGSCHFFHTLRRAIGRGKTAPTLPPGRRSRAAQANLGTAGLHIAPAQGTGGDAQMRASTAQGQAPGHDRFIGALLVGQIRHLGLQIGFQLGRRGKNGFA